VENEHVSEAVLSGPAAVAPADRYDLRKRVASELTAFVGRQAGMLGEISADFEPVIAALRAFLDGGKGMRPAFCYWGWRAAGGADRGQSADEASAVRAAASLELLHASALMHDDYIDGSDTRRGAPSIHRRFEELHRRGGWEGEPLRFGAAAAVLLGDLTLVWCDELFSLCGLDAARIQAARPVFDLMRSEVMAGQYLDVLAQARGLSVSSPQETLTRAQAVVRYKSAKYTIERPLQLGAALATGVADGPLAAALSRYGLPLGEAFQLRDDVLGVFGDPAVTGKPADEDLRAGKQTLLLVLARQLAGPRGRAALDAVAGNEHATAAQLADARKVLASCGALAAVEQRIARLAQQAQDAVTADGEIPPEARRALLALAGQAAGIAG
jgi:geranylgeranyl diphosphate synthase type I